METFGTDAFYRNRDQKEAFLLVKEAQFGKSNILELKMIIGSVFVQYFWIHITSSNNLFNRTAQNKQNSGNL